MSKTAAETPPAAARGGKMRRRAGNSPKARHTTQQNEARRRRGHKGRRRMHREGFQRRISENGRKGLAPLAVLEKRGHGLPHRGAHLLRGPGPGEFLPGPGHGPADGPRVRLGDAHPGQRPAHGPAGVRQRGEARRAGTLVPITGFANAVVSPAIEFKSEKIVTGTCAKMFTIAGPVLVMGITASILYGLILWALGLAG